MPTRIRFGTALRGASAAGAFGAAGDEGPQPTMSTTKTATRPRFLDRCTGHLLDAEKKRSQSSQVRLRQRWRRLVRAYLLVLVPMVVSMLMPVVVVASLPVVVLVRMSMVMVMVMP